MSLSLASAAAREVDVVMVCRVLAGSGWCCFREGVAGWVAHPFDSPAHDSNCPFDYSALLYLSSLLLASLLSAPLSLGFFLPHLSDPFFAISVTPKAHQAPRHASKADD